MVQVFYVCGWFGDIVEGAWFGVGRSVWLVWVAYVHGSAACNTLVHEKDEDPSEPVCGGSGMAVEGEVTAQSLLEDLEQVCFVESSVFACASLVAGCISDIVYGKLYLV